MGLTCIPLVAETLGGLADNFISTIRDIADQLLFVQVPTVNLFGRGEYIALWRGNASMLIHRSPTLSPALDGHT